jgi:hypothetical protein
VRLLFKKIWKKVHAGGAWETQVQKCEVVRTALHF